MQAASCNEFLQLLARLGSVVESAEDLDSFFSASLRLVEDLLGVEGCSIFLLDTEDQRLRVKAATRIPREEWESIEIPVGEGIVGRVAQIGRPVWAKSEAELTALRPKGGSERYRNSSFISVPIRLSDETVGVINVDSRRDGEAFSEDDLDLLQGVAGLFASALSNSLLLKQRTAANQYFNSILQSVRMGVLVFSENLVLTHSNRAAATLLGFDPRVSGDAPAASVLPEPVRKQALEMIAELGSATGLVYREMESAADRDGRQAPLGVSVSALRAGGEGAPGIVVVLEDLSLKREIKALRDLSKLQSHFLCMISHELRTPLTAIKGSMHILRDAKGFSVSEGQRKILEIIDRNVLRLAGLVEDIIEVQSLETEGLKLDHTDVALEEIIRESVKAQSGAWSDKGVRTEIHVNGMGGRRLRLDRDRIRHVFNHLIDNAYKFCSKDGVVGIDVGGTEHEVWARISNTGAPIPAQAGERIFEKFFQVDSGMTRQARGSGLGLYVARSLARLHGGDVTLERSDEKGTAFLVRLPANAAD